MILILAWGKYLFSDDAEYALLTSRDIYFDKQISFLMMTNMQGLRAYNVLEIFILARGKYPFSDDAEYARFAG